jgi:hypothetical protein
MRTNRFLRLSEEEDKVVTVGLTTVDHPDLTMRAGTGAEREDARGVLFWLASYLVGGGMCLQPGETYELDERLLLITDSGDSRLEVEVCCPRA